MKCINCGHENRKGVKFCEECGQQLVENTLRTCPNCGHLNRAGVKFCEECGTALAGGTAAAAAPAAGSAAPPPPVIVQVAAPPRKRRFNPLWLVMLLLFLIVSCCCLLMLLGLVDAPVIAAPIVEQARKVVLIQDNPVDKPPKQKPPAGCEAVQDRLDKVDTNGVITCMPGLNQCWTELAGLDDYKGVDLEYGWDGTVQGKAVCAPNILNGGKPTCIFPFDPQSNRVDFWFSIGNCRQFECWSEGWLPGQAPAPVPPVAAPPTCEDHQTELASAKLGEKTTCFVTSGLCTTEITGMNYREYEISYRWQGGSITKAQCEDTGTALKCSFPFNTQSDVVDFWASFAGCPKRYLGNSGGWLDDSEVKAPEPPPSAPVCCEVVDASGVKYFRDPPEVGPLNLGFKLSCDQPWALDDGFIDFDAYIGANGDIPWGSGSCSLFGEDTRQLECAADVEKAGQKKSRTTIVLEGCPSLDITFQSPFFTPPEPGASCPSGQSMCNGSCCSSSCCDSVSGCIC